jgi:hypothetical protein
MLRARLPVLAALAAALLVLAASAVRAQSDPAVVITAPAPNADVGGVVEITGTIAPPGLVAYFFEVAPFLSDPATTTWTPVTLPASAPVTDGVLATWDTTILDAGVYALRARLYTAEGERFSDLVRPIRVVAGPPPAPTAPPEPTRVPRPTTVNELPVPVGGQLDNFDEEAAVLMREAGMTWIKWQIPYIIGDTSLFTVARDRINWSHERGFFVFLSLKGSKDELAAVGEDEYFPLYAEFAGQIAALGPDAIQIWNEMNLDREWPQGTIDPRSYTELLRQSYTAIKAVDPVVQVITGAPAPTGAEGAFGLDRVWNDDRYYLGMSNAGAAQYSDCIGIHYNEGILPPSAQGGDPRGEYPTYYFQQMIQRAAFPFRGQDTPFCFSELGYLSPDGYGTLPAGFAWGQNTSVAEQAAWLAQAVEIAGNTANPRIGLIIVFNVNYTRFVDGDPQGGFAIIRPDRSCPACETLAALRQPQQ